MGWREQHAPHGLQQLAGRLGMTTDQLVSDPYAIAAYIGTAEGGSGTRAKAVAESFLDLVDVNGGGARGVLKSLPSYDTMTMRSPTTIGSPGEVNSVIAGYDPAKGSPLYNHVKAISEGRGDRVLPEGYTQNYSPSAAAVQPTRGWSTATAPDGTSIYSPSWAVDPVRKGQYVNFGGEILVPGGPDHASKVAWSKAQPYGPDGLNDAGANGPQPLSLMPMGGQPQSSGQTMVASAQGASAPSPQPAQTPPTFLGSLAAGDMKGAGGALQNVGNAFAGGGSPSREDDTASKMVAAMLQDNGQPGMQGNRPVDISQLLNIIRSRQQLGTA